MEVSTEISQKIRSAIKAKLMELGAYVDDELPDYIMVMVANKKSRLQMSNDLGLFLGTNTEAFTGWLHGLLGKLQTITVESGDKTKPKVSKERKKDKKDVKEKKKSKKQISETSSSKKKPDLLDKSEQSHTESNQTVSSETTIETVKDITLKSKTPKELGAAENDGADIENNKAVSIQEDVEDVRQLLVTGTQADELAEELETTEEEVKKSLTTLSVGSKTPKPEGSIIAKEKEISTTHNAASETRSPTPDKSLSSATNRKRKMPISVVASVSKKSDNEEEYDPYNPAVGSVASVVRVTSRRSSVPASLQANRALLLKAMSEAEKSIAVKRKIAVARPITRSESPHESYSPKRKRSEPSPPPYIPSRKELSSRKSSERHALSHGDARHALGREKRKELTSRSRREEILRAEGVDRSVSGRSDPLRSPQKRKLDVKTEDHDQIERQVKGDANSGTVKNFQITARVVSPQPIKIERTSPVAERKSSVASRLGKVVGQRRPRDAREDIKLNRSKSRQEEGSGRIGGRVISRLGKAAVQKQCEEAVKSVKSSKSNDKVNAGASPDSRVVCCDSESVGSAAETEDGVEVVKRRDAKSSSKESLQEREVEESMSDDLAEMLEDEFTLDLDDDDLTNVVGEIDEDAERTRAVEKKDDGGNKSGTRFIVTLDGVDERQFDTSESSSLPQQPLPVTPTASTSELQKEKLLLDILAAQTRSLTHSAIQQTILPLTQATQALANRLQPPKIQPFSINLKDSDDEHEDKEIKSSGVTDDSDDLLTVLKKAKMSERCKFWPACAAGSACDYHHPTTHCKTFPNCKFGDKCLFIHPNCKFDSKCARPDCPFTHTSRRPNISGAAHVIAIPQPHVIFPPPAALPHYKPGTQVTCRFFPNCYNVNCAFSHPKPCRFGVACKNSLCTFFHPPLPGRNKLKWQAKTDVSKVKPPASQTEEYTSSSPSYSTAVSSTSL